MQPPSLTFQRQLRKASSAIISFTPASDPSRRQVIHPRAYVILLTDLFLLCEWSLPNEISSPNQDLSLLYPPLAGKHLRVSESANRAELEVSIMGKENLTIRFSGGEGEAREWKVAMEEAARFGQNRKLMPFVMCHEDQKLTGRPQTHFHYELIRILQHNLNLLSPPYRLLTTLSLEFSAHRTKLFLLSKVNILPSHKTITLPPNPLHRIRIILVKILSTHSVLPLLLSNSSRVTKTILERMVNLLQFLVLIETLVSLEINPRMAMFLLPLLPASPATLVLEERLLSDPTSTPLLPFLTLRINNNHLINKTVVNLHIRSILNLAISVHLVHEEEEVVTTILDRPLEHRKTRSDQVRTAPIDLLVTRNLLLLYRKNEVTTDSTSVVEEVRSILRACERILEIPVQFQAIATIFHRTTRSIVRNRRKLYASNLLNITECPHKQCRTNDQPRTPLSPRV